MFRSQKNKVYLSFLWLLGGHKEAEFVSPRQSPIMFDNPKSSTPYKQTRKAQDFNGELFSF